MHIKISTFRLLAAGEEIFEIYMHISAFLQDGKWWGGSPFPDSKMVNGGGGSPFGGGGSPFPASKMVNGGGGSPFPGSKMVNPTPLSGAFECAPSSSSAV